jgi:ABC-2 type transport system ATP-binding protein
MSTRTPVILARDVTKSFGEQHVLNQVDLTVEEGTVFALLGPNGASKTTMVRILCTLIPADAGQIEIAGHDLANEAAAVRSVIGMTGQFSAVDNLLTGAENLRLMADLRRLGRETGRRRVSELLERFDLADAADKPLSTYSGGMRRRLDLAMTLVGDPRLIFLDEPTTGLDPRSRRTMWQIITELVAAGTTIFLTTQYLEEADRLADALVVLEAGRIVAQGTPTALKRQVPGGHVHLQFADRAALEKAAALFGMGAPAEEALSWMSRRSRRSVRCASFSTACTRGGSRSRIFPSKPLTSTTSSSRSPAIRASTPIPRRRWLDGCS